MSATTAERDKIWINPAMLKWAREWRGRTIEEAAAKLNKSPDQIVNWENDIGSPTVKQARKLAEFYGRAFLEFFLPEPLAAPRSVLVPDFRMHAGEAPPAETWELRELLRWIDEQRANALDLFAELNEEPPEFPSGLFATPDSDPEDAATRTREALDFSIQDQINLTKTGSAQLPTILRRNFESLGILTLRRSDLKDFNARGVCLAKFPLPVVVFRSESQSAQAFTLVHELAHVILKQSGITGVRTPEYARHPIETWCDRFAASFLMPTAQIVAIAGQVPEIPRETMEDSELDRLAEIFRVSRHAMLIRLVHLNYIQAGFYWGIKKPQFDQEEEQYHSFARTSYYASRYRSALGDLYTGLVLEAWTSGRITGHNAAEFMGIKNIQHLYDIRDNFGAQ